MRPVSRLTSYASRPTPHVSRLIRLFIYHSSIPSYDYSDYSIVHSPHSPVLPIRRFAHSPIRPFADSIISADNSHFLCDYKPSTCNASHLNHYAAFNRYTTRKTIEELANR